ncbi:uncharacterized protein LOC142324985 isoform X2 [Lycorma delicatula]|uniref:uncharacterized protein LOC142324985 isoform X2 n=1 Tax=Lycorma delicatula TaxID=130591 RepID=UPI003F515A70
MKKMVARKLLLVACAAVYSTGANIPENNEIMPQKNNNELIDNKIIQLEIKDTDEDLLMTYVNNTVLKIENAIKCLQNNFIYCEDYYTYKIKLLSEKLKKNIRKDYNLLINTHRRQKRSILHLYNDHELGHVNETIMDMYCKKGNILSSAEYPSIKDKQWNKIRSVISALKAISFIVNTTFLITNCTFLSLKCEQNLNNGEMADVGLSIVNKFNKEFYETEGVICKMYYLVKDFLNRVKTYFYTKPLELL